MRHTTWFHVFAGILTFIPLMFLLALLSWEALIAGAKASLNWLGYDADEDYSFANAREYIPLALSKLWLWITVASTEPYREARKLGVSRFEAMYAAELFYAYLDTHQPRFARLWFQTMQDFNVRYAQSTPGYVHAWAYDLVR